MFQLRIERFLRAWKAIIGWTSYQVGARPRSLAASPKIRPPSPESRVNHITSYLDAY